MVRERAATLIAAIPKSMLLLITKALLPLGRLMRLEEGQDWMAQAEALRARAARALIEAFPDPGEGGVFLDKRLRALDAWERTGPAGLFAGQIADTDPDYAARLIEVILAVAERPISRFLGPLLMALHARDATRATELARRASALENVDLVAAAVFAYSSWAAEATADDIPTLRTFVIHAERAVRFQALRSLAPLSRRFPEEAVLLVLDVPIGTDVALAEELLIHIHPDLGLDLALFADEQLVALLDNLRDLSGLEGHWVGKFLENSSARIPQVVMEFLLDRLSQGREEGYRPLPYIFDFALPGLASSPNYAAILRRIRDVLLARSAEDGTGGTANWMAGFWLAPLYHIASQGYDQTGLVVLEEWFAGTPLQILTVGRLLRDVPRQFVFAEREFVSRLLIAAAAKGEAVYNVVIESLIVGAVGGTKTGTPGEPFPEDIALYGRATACLKELRAGSPQYRFYSMLRDIATAEIERAQQQAEELDEE